MSDVMEDVRQFLQSQLRIADVETLTADYPLIKRGVLDSIEIMQLVAFLETTYGIQIDDTDIVPENVGSLASIEAMVARKRPASA